MCLCVCVCVLLKRHFGEKWKNKVIQSDDLLRKEVDSKAFRFLTNHHPDFKN